VPERNTWTEGEWQRYVASFSREVPPAGAIVPRSEQREGLSGINDPSMPLYQALTNIAEGITVGGGAGIPELPSVNMMTSVRVSAVYRAIQLIAGPLSTLPLKLYEDRPDGSRARAYPQEYRAIWWEPNPEMDLPDFYKTSFAHNALGGNTYWYLVRDRLGQLAELWPVAPNRVRVGRDPQTRRKVFEIDGELPMMDISAGGEIVHIPNLTLDGLVGLNPIAFARLSMQLARATEEYGARVFANGSVPMGILETAAELDDSSADRLARRWERFHKGTRNAGRIAILDNGAQYKKVTLSPEDAQFLETRRFQIQEIARLFGVPPHLLADSSNSTSWGSGLEAQTRGMLIFTFQDYTNRFEYALSRRVIGQPTRYVRFDYRSMLRGSTLERYQAYNLAIAAGWLSRNEVREFEDLERGPAELDEFLQPLNMTPAGGDAVSEARMSEMQAAIDDLRARIEAEAA
jgi:HK97 family phage portal protein